MFKKRIAAAIAAILTTAISAAVPPDEPFGESFEGTQIYKYWALPHYYGSLSLSKDHAYSGLQALKLTSAPGGQRDLRATHKFSKPLKGNISVAFYDVAPGQETLYEALTLSDSTSPSHSAGVGTQDFDAFCYTALVGSGGPNANCGIYPQLSTTPVPRTAGWHVFSISYDLASVSIAIDGVLIYTATVDYKFDTVTLSTSGPYWRPDTVAYFDNYSFTPLSAYVGQ